MEKALYTEILHYPGDVTKKTTYYESKNKLYVSYIIVCPHGTRGGYHPATRLEQAIATLALIEQMSTRIKH